MKIMIVEDDQTLRTELKTLLEKYNYEVFLPKGFARIPEHVKDVSPHLVLLDLGLPMYDGFYICREIRKTSGVPIIVVTSKNTEMDELMSMNLGADDFITKPYNTRILLARIENVLRRAFGNQTEPVLAAGCVSLHLNNSTVSAGEQSRELTKNELKILHLLMQNQGTILSRERIMTELWQSDEFVDDNTLTVNISRLRKKIEEMGVVDFVKTKKGQGYMV